MKSFREIKEKLKTLQKNYEDILKLFLGDFEKFQKKLCMKGNIFCNF